MSKLYTAQDAMLDIARNAPAARHAKAADLRVLSDWLREKFKDEYRLYKKYHMEFDYSKLPTRPMCVKTVVRDAAECLGLVDVETSTRNDARRVCRITFSLPLLEEEEL